jgi:cysteinyl-tRNA synthetase
MSKSLKNFITIRGALKEHSPRQMRLVFLMHKYNAPMDYGDNTMQQALVVESKLVEFFHNVKAILRETPLSHPQKFNNKEKDLLDELEAAKANIRAAFLDDFDTPAVLQHLLQLIKNTNKYLEAPEPSSVLLTSVATYVTRTLKVRRTIAVRVR